jgi:hypothetical protein
VLFEGLASKGSGLVNEVGAMGKGFEQLDQASSVAGFDLPAAVVFFNDTGGGSLPWSDE